MSALEISTHANMWNDRNTIINLVMENAYIAYWTIINDICIHQCISCYYRFIKMRPNKTEMHNNYISLASDHLEIDVTIWPYPIGKPSSDQRAMFNAVIIYGVDGLQLVKHTKARNLLLFCRWHFQCNFINANIWMLFKISSKCIFHDPVDNALTHWHLRYATVISE